MEVQLDTDDPDPEQLAPDAVDNIDTLSFDDHGFLFSDDLNQSIPAQSVTRPETSSEYLTAVRTDPLSQIQNDLSVWCFQNSQFAYG